MLVAAAVALVVVSVGTFWYLGYRQGNVVLKTVNGQNITLRDLDRRGNLIKFLYGLTGPLDTETKKAILDTMVDEKLIRDEAQKRGFTVTDDELAALTSEWAGSLTTTYKSPLGITVARLRFGVTEAELTEYARLQIYTQKVYDDVTKDITQASVTEADIQAMYEEEKSTLDAQGLSLEQARDTLTQDVLSKKRGDTYTKFLDELRSKATITGPGLPG